ncbi:MAG TPA: hypothetical protein VK101_03595 [Limnochordia bacterium]|jgi:hypothetical protein|nr:hypothetical protein [Limnochordia bacterium]
MDERDGEQQGGTTVGNDAIKWSAIVIIVLAILYFLAQFVIPLFR